MKVVYQVHQYTNVIYICLIFILFLAFSKFLFYSISGKKRNIWSKKGEIMLRSHLKRQIRHHVNCKHMNSHTNYMCIGNQHPLAISVFVHRGLKKRNINEANNKKKTIFLQIKKKFESAIWCLGEILLAPPLPCCFVEAYY